MSPTLRLILKSPTLKAGDHLKYSLELTNISSSPIRVTDNRAFFKSPHLTASIDWQFWLTKPDGSKVRLAYGDTTELAARRVRRLPQTPAEEAASIQGSPAEWARRDLEAQAQNSLDVVLKPGETLRSRACSQDPDAASGPSIRRGPGFCNFPSNQSPNTPGRYRLTVIMIDVAPDMDDPFFGEVFAAVKNPRFKANFRRAHAQHLGRVESNSAEFEVAP